MKKNLATLLLALPLAQTSSAAILFADSFDRPDNRNIDGSTAGITNNTGSALGTENTWIHGFIDPNNDAPTYGVQDGEGANGGGARIISNTLELATGTGTSNAFVNHNFVNSSILAAGGFRVTVDVTAYPNSERQFGGGFAVGMSLDGANSAADPYLTSTPSMVGAFTPDPNGFIGAPVAPDPTNIVSDFWVALRGNNSLVWGGRTGNVMGVGGLTAKTGTISVDFLLGDFSDGSTVNYEVFLDSTSQGTGTFTWTGTNENYIGLDARSSGTSFDNFVVETIPEPSAALLGLLGAAALLRRRR